MSIIFIGLLMGLCLVLAGGITMLRTAFIRLSRVELTAPPETTDKTALYVLVGQQDNVLSALTVGYLFFVLSAIILMTHYLLIHLNDWQIALHCVLLTMFIIPVTDVFPRAFVMRQPAEFAVSMARAIRIAFVVFNIPAKLLAFLGRQLMVLLKPGAQPKQTIFNTGDYYTLVSRFYEDDAGSGTNERKDYDIQRILQRFITLPVTAIMTKVAEIKIMDANLPVEELIPAIFESNAARVLLYQDRPENIAGLLHTSLLMKSFCLAEGDKNQTDITSAISEPVFISSDISVFDQLQDFSNRHEQYALIRNNRGELQGAVSMEMILEKLFAELKHKPLLPLGEGRDEGLAA